MAKEKQTITSEDVGNVRIVAATGVAAHSDVPHLGKTIEKAMSDAVLKCYADGITDPDEQRAAMLAARDKVKAQFAEAVRKAAEAANKQ